ncbi:MAG TPA: outer membrane beta-barrel protein [Bacteroidales bacterium]|nr:outer membrane beta-barrel protein [Bacteroidales bacterium]HPI67595.1 outer membrane beta-barrel protein [Bacteroidales bacterium]HPR72100.1 outer membrane beta-barrel protein [Bacteroidales bacterium]
MDRQEANIDLLFRNGLKDHEVLPPNDVWNKLRPVVNRPKRPLIILRSAAMIALLVSLGFLILRYSRQLPVNYSDNIINTGQESNNPVINTSDFRNFSSDRKSSSADLIADASFRDNTKQPINAVNNVKRTERIIFPGLSEIRPPANISGPLKKEVPSPENNTDFLLNQYENTTISEPVGDAGPKTPKWTIAALASPAYYSRFISGNEGIASAMTTGQQPAFSYSGGVAVSYKINKRLSVQSGLYYSSVGQDLSGISTYGGFQQYDYTKGDPNFSVRTANGVVNTNNSDVFLVDNIAANRILTRYTNDVFDPAKANLTYFNNSLHQSFAYLELPFILRYKVVDKTLDFNLIGGVSSNFLVNNSVYTSYEGRRYEIGETEGLNLISFSSSLGMGMEYNLSNNLSFNLEPTFRYYINPFSSVEGVKIHPYSFGVFSGITYKF